MHELSICRSLLREVERVAAANGSAEVIAITVAVGPLAGVEPSLLQRAFGVARCGTIADGARLEVEAMPIIVRCEACAAETQATVNALRCGQCGTWQVEIMSGNELLLKRVDLAAAAQPVAAAG